MTPNLPTELLRSFVSIVESGSMMAASDQTCVTQSALSLQMKRLAEIVRTPIFERRRRRLLLTTAGEELLVFARGILDLNDRVMASIGREVRAGPARLGLPQDFAVPLLSGVLVRFMQKYPDIRLQVRVSNTTNLGAEFSAGLLDIMLGLCGPEDTGTVSTAQMEWCGNPRLSNKTELPLAIMESPCLFRDAALTALEKAGRPHRIVLETPSVAILKAAIDGGLAITCRTASVFGGKQNTFEIKGAPLPKVGFLMRENSAANPLILRLSEYIRQGMCDLEILLA